jgi:GNAT superfamily N-acetyltransferase
MDLLSRAAGGDDSTAARHPRYARLMTIGTEPPLATIRTARATDARGMAETYVASWRDTYPELVPTRYLIDMSVDREAAALHRRLSIPGHKGILVAESVDGRILGLAEVGRIREKVAGYAGELFVLYVHPDAFSQGIGRALLRAAARHLCDSGIESLLVWVLAGNPARWFYEAEGGVCVARRTIPFAGASLPALAYGWPDLAALARVE